jgi:hypothetical protein
MFFRKHFSCALPSDVIPTASVHESDGLPSVCSAFVLQFEINILLKFQTTALSSFGNLFYVSCTSVLPFETEFTNRKPRHNLVTATITTPKLFFNPRSKN